MPASEAPLSQWLSELRRELHAHPEIGYEEIWTSEKIAATLDTLGVEWERLDDITGVVGLIRGTEEGPTIGLRADIDALPIRELSPVDYKSVNEGRMHACGHDANTTIMLGVAKKIMDTGLPGTMHGNVKFLFQPAEERVAGAREMIAKGVLENPWVDRVIAGHMAPDLPVGRVGVFRSTGYASADRFVLTITGKGGHGARPEQCLDPIVAGAHFVTQIQSIVSRTIAPAHAAVVTVGRFHAGDVGNVIPESAGLEGTIRTLNEEVRETTWDRLKSIAAGIEAAFKVRCALELKTGVPVLKNDSEVAGFLHAVSVDLLGSENVAYLPPIMGSEDFVYFTQARPSAIMRLGCSNPEEGIVHPLHSPYFDIDERVLEIGSDIFYEAVRRYLDASG